MEYVIARYPVERDVFIDWQAAGKTNRILMVEKGHHRFDLGRPGDYTPDSHDLTVESTTELTPLILEFSPKGGIS
ncbi:MAG TPA: hypothetical protein VLU73_18235 [Methylococcaceae bacterium]|jgi:hypothetical protein|nr:hypothetical protein [Methylococcaceae bacterium]